MEILRVTVVFNKIQCKVKEYNEITAVKYKIYKM